MAKVQEKNDDVLAGIAVGSLPIKYLGLPLMTKAMSRADCEPLIAKIKAKMLAWEVKFLSYAGRLQLLKSVISSLTNFWFSAFKLPSHCIKSIESLCSSFLWSGSHLNSSKAKVSWTEVCNPKDEGGLGIRPLKLSAKIFNFSLIWRLISGHDSLWVSWTRHYLLRYSSFWDPKLVVKGSWMWRKLLKLRTEAYKFFKTEIRSGFQTFFWFDNWSTKGRLFDVLGESGTRYLGLSRLSKVADAVLGSEWNYSSASIRRFPELMNSLCAEPIPSSLDKDRILCKYGESVFGETFSALHIWEQIRLPRNKVDWSKLIWFPQGVPRFTFIAWLAIRDRLATGARTRLWGHIQDCVFCGDSDESRDHLFFACPFSFSIWRDLCGGLLGGSISSGWSENIEALSSSSMDPMDLILSKMVFQTAIYYIWKERNSRIHGGNMITTERMGRLIDKVIRNRISSLHYNGTHKYEGLRRRWFAHRIS